MKRKLMICIATLAIGTSLNAGEGAEAKQNEKITNPKEFVKGALEGSQTELQAGRMAQAQGRHPAVRQLGETLVNDHQKIKEKLQELAQKHNVAASQQVQGKHKDELTRLQQASRENFDRVFLNQIINDHQRDLGLLREASEQFANDSGIKQLIEQNLPLVRRHLEMAQAASKNLAATRSNRNAEVDVAANITTDNDDDSDGNIEFKKGDGEILGLPTSNKDGTIAGILPAPSREVEAGDKELYIAEELADGKVDPGVEDIDDADQDLVPAPARQQRNQQANQASQQSGKQQKQNAAGKGEQDRQQVQFRELPQPVQKTMRAHAGNLNVENIRKLNKKEQVCYEGTFDKGSLKGKLIVAEDGSLIQMQQGAEFAMITAVPKVEGSEVQLSDLPQAVQQTIRKESGTKKIGEISKSKQSGQTVYQAAFNEGGVHTELIVKEDGTLVGRMDQTALFIAPLQGQQKVSLQSVPEAVRQTVQEHAGQSRAVSDLDKGTWQGQTAYKVMVEINGVPTPLVVSENGELLGQQRSASGAPAAAESNRQQNQKGASQSDKRSNQ